jgi:hypothetical protein
MRVRPTVRLRQLFCQHRETEIAVPEVESPCHSADETVRVERCKACHLYWPVWTIDMDKRNLAYDRPSRRHL